MERNVTLDFVRGVAILGILLLNISAFGLPKAAYLNPAWYGAITPQDAWTWAFLDLIGQVKFLTLFANALRKLTSQNCPRWQMPLQVVISHPTVKSALMCWQDTFQECLPRYGKTGAGSGACRRPVNNC